MFKYLKNLQKSFQKPVGQKSCNVRGSILVGEDSNLSKSWLTSIMTVKSPDYKRGPMFNIRISGEILQAMLPIEPCFRIIFIFCIQLYDFDIISQHHVGSLLQASIWGLQLPVWKQIGWTTLRVKILDAQKLALNVYRLTLFAQILWK